MKMFHNFCISLAIGFWSLLPDSTVAQTLAAPQGEVILHVSGEVSITNQPGSAQFDLALLDSLPQRETVTTTPWFDGPQSFSGPTLSDLVSAVGATGSSLRVIAINDYAVDIPMTDVAGYPVILASRHQGELMAVRDKGPLFVVFPFDEVPELMNEVYFSRSVWQVSRIEVLP